MPGRKNAFCSSVPRRRIVGPTIMPMPPSPPARRRLNSSRTTRAARGDISAPPYSSGHVGSSHRCAPCFFQNSRWNAHRSGSSSNSQWKPSYSTGSSAASQSRTSARNASSFGVVVNDMSIGRTLYLRS
jgi:hypothetical protein